MIIRKFFLFLCIACLCYNSAYSQQDDFCNALTTIIRDAPNRFLNIKGKVIESNINAIVSESGIKVPGTIGSRFIVSQGSFYEGAFLQSVNKGDIKAVYDKYKDLLSGCLVPQGYVVSFVDNFSPGLEEYKKMMLMPELKQDAKTETPPAHASMEVIYNKDIKKYILVMYIFEH